MAWNNNSGGPWGGGGGNSGGPWGGGGNRGGGGVRSAHAARPIWKTSSAEARSG